MANIRAMAGPLYLNQVMPGRVKGRTKMSIGAIMYTSAQLTPLVSNTMRQNLQKVRVILRKHSIEIRALEGGRVLKWSTSPFGSARPEEYPDLMSVVTEQLPLTKDDRLLAYVG